jgi:hypothetical protein
MKDLSQHISQVRHLRERNISGSETLRCYGIIERHYGDKRARRSGRRYMCHIDEGLSALQVLGATQRTMGAWCLHPVVQDDADLVGALRDGCLSEAPVESVVLAMEYRHWANAHLSFHDPTPQYGPCEEVRQMLTVDKVQNRKDFERYLYEPGRLGTTALLALCRYYKEWFDALGITEEQHLLLLGAMETPTGPTYDKGEG